MKKNNHAMLSDGSKVNLIKLAQINVSFYLKLFLFKTVERLIGMFAG